MAETDAADRNEPDLDDTVLLLRHARATGDRLALDRALARVRPRLERWIAARMGPRMRSRMDVEDVVQETLLALVRGLDGIDAGNREQFFGWLLRVAENRIRDAAAHVDAQRRSPDREVPRSGTLPGARTTPSGGLARAEEQERLLLALAGLPAPYREVIRLVRLEGRSHAEVAEALGITANNVAVRLFRALQALGDAMSS